MKVNLVFSVPVLPGWADDDDEDEEEIGKGEIMATITEISGIFGKNVCLGERSKETFWKKKRKRKKIETHVTWLRSEKKEIALEMIFER